MGKVKDFHCPKCKSSLFGSDTGANPWIGYCHGDYCEFKWPRDCDYKYFHYKDEERQNSMANKTASSYVKSRGLKNIKQMIELTGRDRSTLNRWFNNERVWFEIVVTGCLEANKGKDNA